MPSIHLHPRALLPSKPLDNPLPQLLQTPSGLAILELQGTINFPSSDEQQQQHNADNNNMNKDEPPPADNEPPTSTSAAAPPTAPGTTFETPLGKLLFPDYSPQSTATDDTSWMKRVYLYVGRYQRMAGEVKKLGQPIVVVQRRQGHGQGDPAGETDELEILEVVKYKMIFTNRPEPVSDN